MNSTNFSPTFRNVLLQEVVKDNRTSGGIIIPSSVLESRTPEKREYQVVKTGKDCIEVKTGDIVKLMRGLIPEEMNFEDQELFQVMEQQIIGYCRN